MKHLTELLNESMGIKSFNDEALYESILDDPDTITKDLEDAGEDPFKYLARLGPDVWKDKNKIRKAFEIFRAAITKECKIKPGDKATGAKNKIAFDFSEYGPAIWVKEGSYSHAICQSSSLTSDKYGWYLQIRDVGKSYAAHHFRGCDVYIPSKKLVEQFIEFKGVMWKALSYVGEIKDKEALNEYIK